MNEEKALGLALAGEEPSQAETEACVAGPAPAGPQADGQPAGEGDRPENDGGGTGAANAPEGEDSLRALLVRLEASAGRRERYAKRRLAMARLTALACVVMAAVALYSAALLIPRVNLLLDGADAAMADLTVVSRELASLDIRGTVEGVDGLVKNAQIQLDEATGQIASIDFATLNKAIKDLADAVEPLANLFRR